MSIMANLGLALIDKYAAKRGRNLKVTIDDKQITWKYVKPKSTDKYVWEDHYINGGLYWKGYAEPLFFEGDTPDKLELRRTSYLDTVVNQHELKQAVNTAGDGLDMMEKLMLANIGAIVLLGVILISAL